MLKHPGNGTFNCFVITVYDRLGSTSRYRILLLQSSLGMSG